MTRDAQTEALGHLMTFWAITFLTSTWKHDVAFFNDGSGIPSETSSVSRRKTSEGKPILSMYLMY